MSHIEPVIYASLQHVVTSDCVLLLWHLHDGSCSALAEYADCHPHGCVRAGTWSALKERRGGWLGGSFALWTSPKSIRFQRQQHNPKA